MNAYKILQVDRDAEPEVIDAAYRRLASKYHPDKDPSPSATARMKEINAAYEVLRDPERRAEYDRRRERLRTERPQPQAKPEGRSTSSASTPAASQDLAAEVSSRVFKKVLWAAAFIALLVYFPWGIALLLGVWGLIWIVKRHPGAVAKVLQWSLAIGVALGVYFWMRHKSENERQEKTERELADLDIRAVLDKELGAFTASCVKRATQDSPQLADAYCTCLADALQAQFDTSSINAYSVEDYRRQFSARFAAASPTLATQTACVEKVRPKPVALPQPKTVKPRKSSKPAEPGGNEIDPAVRDALTPRPRLRDRIREDEWLGQAPKGVEPFEPSNTPPLDLTADP